LAAEQTPAAAAPDDAEPARGPAPEGEPDMAAPSDAADDSPAAAAPSQLAGGGRRHRGRQGGQGTGDQGQGDQSNGHANGHGRFAGRTMQIVFRPSGDLERDKYRLKEIYEMVRDPRGRDHFLIVLQTSQNSTTLAFPNDPCSISERLQQELFKFFRVDVSVAD
jgi:hypothetical protein